MSTLTATPTERETRFEAARLPDGYGWTVVDLLSRAAIVPGRRWDEDRARTLAGLLSEAPAYAVQFRWTEPGHHPLRWRDVLAAAGGAGAPHEPTVTTGGGGASRLCAFCWQPAASVRLEPIARAQDAVEGVRG